MGGKKAKRKKQVRGTGHALHAAATDALSKAAQRRQHRAAAIKQEVAEEILALQAIYGEDFVLHEDGTGFALHIVPHPGALEANFCSVQLHVRYSAGYPATALQLRVRDADGLNPDEARRLAQQLADSAAQHASQDSICVFDLVDACQEFLRNHNDVAEERRLAAQQQEQEDPDGSGSSGSSAGGPQSLWHAMQQRLAAAEAEADEAQGGSLVGLLGEDAWAFDGGLFADEGELSFGVPTISGGMHSTHPGARGRRSARPARPDFSPDAAQAAPHMQPRDLSTSPSPASFASRMTPQQQQQQQQQQPPPPKKGAKLQAAVPLLEAAAAAGAPAVAAAELQQATQQVVQQVLQQAQQQRADVAAAAGPSGDTRTTAPHKQTGGHGTVASQRLPQLLWDQSRRGSFSALPPALRQLLDANSALHAKRMRRRRGRREGQQQETQREPQRVERGLQPSASNGTSSKHSASDGESSSGSSSDEEEDEHAERARSSSGASTSGSSNDSSSDSSSNSSGGSGDEGSGLEERPSLRSQLLLGHLLWMAASGAPGGVLPPQSLPLLASGLRRSGLLPPWVHWLLRNPAMFDRAFRRLFAQEISEASRPEAFPKQVASQALQRFWDRAALTTALSTGGRPSGSGVGAGAEPGTGPPSRYRSDFQELQRLGRGGYGVVVAAMNRLDGRQYAVKKIRLDTRQPGSFARILREVATLSRLQHPNVVRYFQAWCEAADTDSGDWDEGGETGEWGTASITATTATTATATGSSVSFSIPPHLPPLKAAAARAGPQRLAPVFEAYSGEGLTTGSASTATETTTTEAEADGDGDRTNSESNAPGNARGRQQGHGRAVGSGTDAAAKSSLQVLYIQMEFCPRTLQQVLDAGPMEEQDAWNVLRGVLAGLAYIHSQGIIHRDLKPANIFYDGRGDLKLGDFGLAKFAGSGKDDAAAGAASLPGMQPGPGSPNKRAMDAGPAAPVLQGPSAGASELTGVCGTSFYISPEIANGWASYDERVDLYSLGVVVFELWHPFSTAMERVLLLRDLREAGRLPDKWERDHPVPAKLVRWLMSAKPADRPSARELLQSDLLPPRVEDEQLKDLLRSLPDNPDTFARVVDAVFASSNSATPGTPGATASSNSTAALSLPQLAAGPLVRGAAGAPAAAASSSGSGGGGLLGGLSLGELPGAPLNVHVGVRDAVVKVVRDVFAGHGAVPMASTQIGFCHVGLPKDAVRLLLPSGAVLALRHDVRYPFAAWLAQQAALSAAGAAVAPDNLRRYEVCWVQRSGRGRGLPSVFLQADLDLVGPVTGAGADERCLAEAEAIKCITQVLDALPEGGQYEVRLSHRALLEATVASLAAPKEAAASVMALLNTAASASPAHAGARDKHWPSIRAGLDGLGLDAGPVSRCRQSVLQLPGEVSTHLPKLLAYLKDAALLGVAARAACATALEELSAICGHLKTWGLSSGQLLLEPLLTPHADYFSGALFQVHLVSPVNGATSVIAAGGRYDALLRALWSPAAAALAAAPGAVGATLNVERLVKLVAQQRQPQGVDGAAARVRPSAADVLVCSRGGAGLLKARMELVAQLWSVGIAAELTPRAAPSLTEQYEFAQSRDIRWLVILDKRMLADTRSPHVRVKALDRRNEDLVPLSDLPRYLAAALSGAQDPSRSYASSSGAGISSTASLQRSHSSSDFGGRAVASSSMDGAEDGWHHGAAGEVEPGKRGALSADQRERERNERYHASEREREVTGRHQHHQHGSGSTSRRSTASRWY